MCIYRLNLKDAKTMGLNLVVQSAAPAKKKEAISESNMQDTNCIGIYECIPSARQLYVCMYVCMYILF